MYQNLADTWQVFDNAAGSGPVLVAAGDADTVQVLDPRAWTNLRDRSR